MEDIDYQLVYEYNPDGILVTDAAGVLLNANRMARELLKLSAAGGPDGPAWERPTEMGHLTALRRVIAGEGMVSLEELGPEGRRILVTASPVFNDQGGLLYAVCSLRLLGEPEGAGNRREEEQRRGCQFKRLIASQSAVEKFDFQSQSMQNVLSIVAKVSAFDATVLLLGESGVGKNVIANLIHKLSPRKDKPLIYINCGAIPANLLESELFGYERGAFTGASNTGHTGMIERAQGGTLFFDEVAELPLAMQVKILHFLNEKVIFKIGGKKPIPVDARIISATNKDLAAMTSAGMFREDLFYRLNVLKIQIPPLRQRKEDLLNLIEHYFDYYNKKYFLNKTLGPEALEALLNYSWPGNIRELRNAMEQLAILSESPIVGPEELPSGIIQPENPAPAGLTSGIGTGARSQEDGSESQGGGAGTHPGQNAVASTTQAKTREYQPGPEDGADRPPGVKAGGMPVGAGCGELTPLAESEAAKGSAGQIMAEAAGGKPGGAETADGDEKLPGLEELMEAFEARIFKALYEESKSSYKVAERLGISQSTATRKIKKYLG